MNFSHLIWRKSSKSSGDGQCVEAAHTTTGIALRDSKNQTGPMMLVTRNAWNALLGDVKQ
jgi:hypothetical protein